MKSAGATACVVSNNEAERLKYWSGRKAAFPAVGRIRRTITASTAPSRAARWRWCCGARPR